MSPRRKDDTDTDLKPAEIKLSESPDRDPDADSGIAHSTTNQVDIGIKPAQLDDANVARAPSSQNESRSAGKAEENTAASGVERTAASTNNPHQQQDEADKNSLLDRLQRLQTFCALASKTKYSAFLSRVMATLVDTVIVTTAGSILFSMLCFLLGMFFIPLSLDSVLNLFLDTVRCGIAFCSMFFFGTLVPLLTPVMNLVAQISNQTWWGPHLLSDMARIIDHTMYPHTASFTGASWIITGTVLLAPLVFGPLYYAFMESSPLRATLGKILFGISVTDAEGNRLSFRRALFRHLTKVVSAGLLLLGYLQIFLHPRKQALHDQLTGCLVVNTAFVEEKMPEKKLAPHALPDQIVLRYRSFAEIERWILDRFKGRRQLRADATWRPTWLAPAALIALGFGAYALLMPHMSNVQLSQLIEFFRTYFVPNPNVMNDPDAFSGSNPARNATILIMIMAIVTLINGAIIYYLTRPFRLVLNKTGLSLMSRASSKSGSKSLNWHDIKHITMFHPSGKTSPADHEIHFSGSKETIKLRLGALDSAADRELLLRSIESWAPQVHRDAEVIQALQMPSDHSYTELWLSALTAPPKREQLKPLIEGAKLKDGQYNIIRQIGVGGQGHAYVARDLSGNEVVLKEFILPVFVGINVRRRALEKFEKEARVLQHLDNPNIVKLHDFLIEDHRAYLVLEHIEGGSLKEKVEKHGALGQNEVVKLASQMCDILDYLHGLDPPIIHRDFTPDNMILRKDGSLVLIDFNVVQQTMTTTVATVVGKHAYLPPEQFRGEAVTQSDIYSLGASLYYLLTGSDPIPISSSHPRELKPDISPELDFIIAKATALDVDDRYQTVNNLKADLQALLSS
ncbi:MAG TPA: protein kinase [Candidatus Obscuribacterales bacterium]